MATGVDGYALRFWAELELMTVSIKKKFMSQFTTEFCPKIIDKTSGAKIARICLPQVQ